MEKASENLFSRSFFCAIIGKFDDDREEANVVSGFEGATNLSRKYYYEFEVDLGFASITHPPLLHIM